MPFTEQQTFSANFHTRQKGAKTPHKWDTEGDLLFCWFMILGAFSLQAGRASTSNLHSQVDNAITLSAGAFDASASTGRAQWMVVRKGLRFFGYIFWQGIWRCWKGMAWKFNKGGLLLPWFLKASIRKPSDARRLYNFLWYVPGPQCAGLIDSCPPSSLELNSTWRFQKIFTDQGIASWSYKRPDLV